MRMMRMATRPAPPIRTDSPASAHGKNRRNRSAAPLSGPPPVLRELRHQGLSNDKILRELRCPAGTIFPRGEMNPGYAIRPLFYTMGRQNSAFLIFLIQG